MNTYLKLSLGVALFTTLAPPVMAGSFASNGDHIRSNTSIGERLEAGEIDTQELWILHHGVAKPVASYCEEIEAVGGCCPFSEVERSVSAAGSLLGHEDTDERDAGALRDLLDGLAKPIIICEDMGDYVLCTVIRD